MVTDSDKATRALPATGNYRVVASSGPDHRAGLDAQAGAVVCGQGRRATGSPPKGTPMATASWGVFEDGLCISTAHTRTEAEGDRDFHTGDEDTGLEYKILPLCPHHPDDEEPADDCQSCK